MTTKEEQTLQTLFRIRDNLSTYTDYEKLIEDLRPLLPSVPIAMDGFENQPFYLDRNSQINLIYRAMPIGDDGKVWDQEEDISYLPERLLTKSKAGRANRKGDRVFYGSLHPLSAMIETYSSGPHLQKVLDGHSHECVIGIWEVVQPIKFAMLPFAEQRVLEFIKKRTFIADQGNPVTEENIKAEAAHIRSMVNDEFKYALLEYFSEAFANASEEQYMLSTYYAERIFDKIIGYRTEREMYKGKLDGPVEGLFFNAVPSSYEKRNVVLPIHIVNTKLKLISAHHYLTKFNKENPIPFFLPLETSIPVRDGKIDWRKRYAHHH